MDGTYWAAPRSLAMDDANISKTMSKLDLERWGQGLGRAFPVEGESELSRLLRALDAVPWPPPPLAV
jgi:hypothetical protein